jgi:hypothetical protein
MLTAVLVISVANLVLQVLACFLLYVAIPEQRRARSTSVVQESGNIHPSDPPPTTQEETGLTTAAESRQIRLRALQDAFEEQRRCRENLKL